MFEAHKASSVGPPPPTLSWLQWDGGGGGLAVAKPGRIGSDSVEDSYSVETWLNTGQLRGHSVDWKGLRVGWRGSPFRIRTIRKGQDG